MPYCPWSRDISSPLPERAGDQCANPIRLLPGRRAGLDGRVADERPKDLSGHPVRRGPARSTEGVPRGASRNG
jgi:hypothetical protein